MREADDREREDSLAELLGGGAAKKPSSAAAAPLPSSSTASVAAKRVSLSSNTPSRARAPVESKAAVEDDVQALDPGTQPTHHPPHLPFLPFPTRAC